MPVWLAWVYDIISPPGQTVRSDGLKWTELREQSESGRPLGLQAKCGRNGFSRRTDAGFFWCSAVRRGCGTPLRRSTETRTATGSALRCLGIRPLTCRPAHAGSASDSERAAEAVAHPRWMRGMGRSRLGHPGEAGGGKTEQGAPAERLDGATAPLQTLPGLHFSGIMGLNGKHHVLRQTQTIREVHAENNRESTPGR